ncbi:TetR/AcrR family transcriptional regulator [Microbacterium sp. CR_7]|uniref:TetR/AcrR family transcriptional regulator n=1 Tax=Microbacterium sp. CR_7 TaxID=3055792 RepID=UPI0035C26757
MARPPLYDDALRERLLAATAAMVDEKGPERVSLREIAQTAGTSTSAVYALFGGKNEMLVAVIENGFASFGDSQAAVEADGLRTLGLAYRDWATKNPALYRLMFNGSITTLIDCRPDDEKTGAAMAPLIRTLADRVPADRVTAAALTVWAQVHGAVSLELAAVTPVAVDWDAVYDEVVTAVERAFPAS